jgi:hypothetical protein
VGVHNPAFKSDLLQAAQPHYSTHLGSFGGSGILLLELPLITLVKSSNK